MYSRSYGPGRYDPTYEEGGQDYPIGYVRWTEGRNLEAFVDLLATDAGCAAADHAPLPRSSRRPGLRADHRKTPEPFPGSAADLPGSRGRTAGSGTPGAEFSL